MATFTLTIECDNAAFEDDCNAEVARILGDLSDFIGRKVCFLTNHETGSVRDVNGNDVGSWRYRPALGAAAIARKLDEFARAEVPTADDALQTRETMLLGLSKATRSSD